MHIQCLIVEDEMMASKSLERMCQKTDKIDVIGICETGEDALKTLKNTEVDLIFLDIEMPGISGLELLDQLPGFPLIIFTTSKKEYAYQAFEYEAIDYLKKPFTFSRFSQAVEKVKENLLANHQSDVGDSSDIYIKSDGRYIKLLLDEILYIENVGDYVRIRTPKDNYIVYSSLKNVEARLNPKQFLRVHRSFIINLEKIVDIEENTLVISDKMIPISRANKPTLMSRLNLL